MGRSATRPKTPIWNSAGPGRRAGELLRLGGDPASMTDEELLDEVGELFRLGGQLGHLTIKERSLNPLKSARLNVLGRGRGGRRL